MSARYVTYMLSLKEIDKGKKIGLERETDDKAEAAGRESAIKDRES